MKSKISQKKGIKYLSIIVISLAFLSIGAILIKSYDQLTHFEFEFKPGYLIAYIVFGPFIPFFSTFIWYLILRYLGENAPFMSVWRINMYSQIARYAPGKVWNYLGRMHWGKKIGLDEKKVLFSSVLEMIFMLLGAGLVSCVFFSTFLSSSGEIFLYVSIILVFFLMHPKIISFVVNFFAKRWVLKKEVQISITYPQMLFIVALFVFHWNVMGFENYLLIRSFYDLDLKYVFILNSINAGSWAIGYLVFFVPGGIGVKEGVFTLAFQKIVPVPIAAMIAIVSRFCQVLFELFFAAVFVVFDKGAREMLKKAFKKKKAI